MNSAFCWHYYYWIPQVEKSFRKQTEHWELKKKFIYLMYIIIFNFIFVIEMCTIFISKELASANYCKERVHIFWHIVIRSLWLSWLIFILLYWNVVLPIKLHKNLCFSRHLNTRHSSFVFIKTRTKYKKTQLTT